MDSKLGTALSSLACLTLAALVTAGAGCAGPPIPAPIEGEPICPDIEIGAAHAKMLGGLTYPVRLRILEGKNVMMKMILNGKRLPGDPSSHTLLPDDNAEYVLEWAQCANERAPRHASTNPKSRGAGKDTTAFDCGDAVVYKTDKLVTKKHDAASHAFTFPPPPKAQCWVGEAPPATPAAPPASAPPAPAAPVLPSPSASASAALTPSAAPPSPSAAPSASTAPARK
jgi:hypothetical protein